MTTLTLDFQINVRYLEAKVMRRSEMELKALSFSSAARNAERIVLTDSPRAEIVSMEVIELSAKSKIAPKLVVDNSHLKK